MSTQIKIYLELFRDGKWVCKPAIDINHNQAYYFFALLCGTLKRGSKNRALPLLKNRGLPPDLSDSLAYEWAEYGEWMHDGNYITVAELRAASEQVEDLKKYMSRYCLTEEDFGQLDVFLRDIELYTSPEDSLLRAKNGTRVVLQPDQIRIVFWFDN